MLRPRVLLSAVILAIIIAPGALAFPLMSDPAAMPAWQGSKTFYATDGIHLVDVQVEYAVYAPGAFPGDDASGGTDYVYAYEIFNDFDPDSLAISILTVGLMPGCGAHNIGWQAGPPGQVGGAAPDFASISVSALSARWFFITDTVNYAEDSATLVFTSPKEPRWMSGSVTDGGVSVFESLPSPMPEPATLGLLAAGGLLLLRRRARA